MAKIGDLFVKLGLKSDDFKKGISEAKTETKDFGDRLKSLATVAKASWAAVSAAVVKFAADAISMTQKWGDTWAIEMQGIKGAYGTFVRQLSSGEGWDNLFANMRESYRLAKEVAASMDEIFERNMSFAYEEAETQRTISELQLVMRDASKSDAERMAAARQIIALEQKLGQTKRSIAAQAASDAKRQFMDQTKLTEAETDFLLKNYNLNRDSINQARAYLAERARLESQLGAANNSYGIGAMSQKAYDHVAARISSVKKAQADLEASTPQTIKDLAALTQKYDRSNDKLVEGLVQAEIAVINVDTEINRASTRATAMLGSLTEANRPAVVKAVDPFEGILESIDKEIEALDRQEPVTVEPIKIDDSGLQDWIDSYEAQMARAAAITKEFKATVVSGLSDGCQEIMDQLMGVSESNPGAIIKALLTPLADMAVKAGEVILAEGIAVEAAKAALTTFSGLGAIAAGAALIAIGTAAKAGLSALAANGSSGTASSGSASSSSSGVNDSSFQNSELTIYVKGTIKGSDIVIAGNNTLNKWAR